MNSPTPTPSATIEVASKVIDFYRKVVSLVDPIDGKYADVINYIDSQSEAVKYVCDGGEITVTYNNAAGNQDQLKIEQDNDKSFKVTAKGDRVRIEYTEGSSKKENELRIEVDINNIKNITDPAFMISQKLGKYISPTAGFEEDFKSYETVEDQQIFLNNKDLVPGGNSVFETIDDQFILLETVLKGIKRKKNERFSLADKALLDNLEKTVLEVLLQNFFTDNNVIPEDQSIIKKTIEMKAIHIRIRDDKIYCTNLGNENVDDNVIPIFNVLQYDPESPNRIKNMGKAL